jgi:hypothetical protein
MQVVKESASEAVFLTGEKSCDNSLAIPAPLQVSPRSDGSKYKFGSTLLPKWRSHATIELGQQTMSKRCEVGGQLVEGWCEDGGHSGNRACAVFDARTGRQRMWTPGTDIARFTDPAHTDFWRSDNPDSPAYRGRDND